MYLFQFWFCCHCIYLQHSQNIRHVSKKTMTAGLRREQRITPKRDGEKAMVLRYWKSQIVRKLRLKWTGNFQTGIGAIVCNEPCLSIAELGRYIDFLQRGNRRGPVCAPRCCRFIQTYFAAFKIVDE